MERAICTDRTEDDLAFINEMKNETMRDLKAYHGMRRNSSFADYFEGDLSQNLLSRSHFGRRDSGITSDAANNIVNHIKNKNNTDHIALDNVVNKVITQEESRRKKKLSQVQYLSYHMP